jgi:DHA2 family multidrug resistance protein-like MFS transporter
MGSSDDPTTTDPPAARITAGRKEWIGLAVIALPCLLYAMDLTVLYLAVPSISRDLAPSSAQLLWITDVYGFLLAGFLIPMGTLGDRIGRRRLLLIGAGVFGAVSLAAAFSVSAPMLIASRALLGVAGATLAPSTLSLIRNMFLDSRERTVAIGVWIASFSAGGAIGPLVGGVLLNRFWWGSVFLIALPVMGLLLVLGPRLLPEFRDPEAGRLDLVSAAMSLTAVLTAIYGLKRIAQDGLGWAPVVCMLIGLGIGAAFLWRQWVLPHPLIDLRLFRTPAFSTSLATYTFGIFIAFGASLFIAQYLQLVLDMSPLRAGLWTVPEGAGFIAGSLLTPVIVRRVRPPLVVAAGLVLAAAGFGLIATVAVDSGLAVIVTGSIVFALGLAAVATLATDLIVGTAPPERAGAASALSETGAEFGGAFGIAILGSIGTAVYRAHLSDAMPAGVGPKAAEAAQDTLGGALVAAGHLPRRVGSELLVVAREAFTRGLRVAVIVAAIIAAAMALLVVALLKRVRPSPAVGAELGSADRPIAGS